MYAQSSAMTEQLPEDQQNLEQKKSPTAKASGDFLFC
jgi:hypothetical protein